ncbi:hypothetical protein INR49_014660 [Caranx melampygus]|nr:hypothetical protein INR49_014660 [Caranx melampygus]
MIREQSPDPRLSSGTSTRPSNSFASHFSDPRCSSTVSAREVHWMWQAEEASCPWCAFHLQGRTTFFPTSEVMGLSSVVRDREEESGRREALRMEIEGNVWESLTPGFVLSSWKAAPLLKYVSDRVAGCHWSSASPVLRPARVVQAGQNVTLTCNLTSSTQTTWYLMRSDELLPLLTVEQTRLSTVVAFHSTNNSRIKSLGDIKDGPVSLEILEVEEEDAGLYFCTGRCARGVCFNRAILLIVNGADGSTRDKMRQPCLTLGICVLPALIALITVFIFGLCLCSGKSGACRCHSQRKTSSVRITEDVPLHYSSLRHAYRPPAPLAEGSRIVSDEFHHPLLVLDLQGIVLEAEPAPHPLCLRRAVFVPGEDDLPPAPAPTVKPPLLGFGGTAAGKQQRPAFRDHEVLTCGGEIGEVFVIKPAEYLFPFLKKMSGKVAGEDFVPWER